MRQSRSSTTPKVVALHGEDKLHAVTIRDTWRKTLFELPSCAVFIMIGAKPNAAWLSDMVELDKNGFVLTGAEAGQGPRARRCGPASLPSATSGGVGEASTFLSRRRLRSDFQGVGSSEDLACKSAVKLSNL